MKKHLLINGTVHTVRKTMTGYAIPTCDQGAGWWPTTGGGRTAKRVIQPVTCTACTQR